MISLEQSLPEITTADLLHEAHCRKYRRKDYYFPDYGSLRRELYVKHLDFIKKTNMFRESCFMAANRAGKSETGAYCVAVWLTGEYPDWWDGRRFDKPVNVLVCGETSKLVRDSMQMKLLGMPNNVGSGMIPLDCIIEKRPKAGIPDAVDTVRIKHKSGGESILQFQSYDQGREAFQATERDVILEDEEPPLAIHNENLIRTMTTNGIVILTFTPLKGLSETVMSMQEKAANGICAIVQATWDDAPHLGEKEKQELMASLPPYQRDARSRGIPQLGSGAIYPIPEEQLIVEPFVIPDHWKICYGLDVGWNCTAAIWLAHDVENDVVYVVHEYKQGQKEPALHASSIKLRGAHIKGAIDPASNGRSQKDGEQLIKLYKQQGLLLTEADNTVEAGIFDVYERMTTGRLKVFRTCNETISELRIYRRDDKGKIVKSNDHIMDALRYAVRTGLKIAVYVKDTKTTRTPTRTAPRHVGWMG
jgi:phage terminase large subunit-like protein